MVAPNAQDGRRHPQKLNFGEEVGTGIARFYLGAFEYRSANCLQDNGLGQPLTQRAPLARRRTQRTPTRIWEPGPVPESRHINADRQILLDPVVVIPTRQQG